MDAYRFAKTESMFLIMSLAIRFQLSALCLEYMLQLINLHLPQEILGSLRCDLKMNLPSFSLKAQTKKI